MFAAALVIFAGCGPKEAPPETVSSPGEPPTVGSAEPEPSFEPTYEPVQTFEAWFEADRIEGGKRLQAMYLIVGDEVLVASYRAKPEWLPFVGRRVTVTGRPYTNSPLVQSVMGRHIAIDQIAVAPGEPAPVALTELPPAPVVRDGDAARQMAHRWVQLQGNLDAFRAEPDGSGAVGVVILADRRPVEVTVYRPADYPRWTDLVGKPVTVLGVVSVAADKLKIDGRLTLCPGSVGDCKVVVE